MTDHDLAFWTTAAQIVAVFALAFVVEVRAMFGAPNPDSGWLSWKLFATTFLLSNAVALTIGFYVSVDALISGKSDPAHVTYTFNALSVGFLLLVGGPVINLLLRVWLYRAPKPAASADEASEENGTQPPPPGRTRS